VVQDICFNIDEDIRSSEHQFTVSYYYLIEAAMLTLNTYTPSTGAMNALFSHVPAVIRVYQDSAELRHIAFVPDLSELLTTLNATGRAPSSSVSSNPDHAIA
jgi:hypothetical protein